MRTLMWLGDQKGNLVDWSTQKWEQATGRNVDLTQPPWLSGPIGSTRGIGVDFFDKWASDKQWIVTRCKTGKGLLSSFGGLASPGFDSKTIQPAVANFYERAADYDMDVWSEWSGLFKPFGVLVASLFSRRLEQLNLPLSSLDTSWGMSSEVVQVTDQVGGELIANAWIRTLIKTGRIIYDG